MTIAFHFLGVPRIENNEQPVTIKRRKGIALIAYLCLEHRVHRRDRLGLLLFPEYDRAGGLSRLRRILTALKSELPDSWLRIERTTCTVQPNDDLWVDVWDFRQQVESDNPQDWAAAIECYQGEFLQDFDLYDNEEFDHWLTIQRESLQRGLFKTYENLANHYLQEQQYDQAVALATQWGIHDNLHPEPQWYLLRAYGESGQRVEAVRHYQQYAKRLQDEMNLEPDPELVTLYEQIRDEEPLRRGMGSSTPKQIVNVLLRLPGLVVGRDDALRDIKERLKIQNGIPLHAMAVIQGWPGVGKSTLVALLAHDEELVNRFPDGILWTSLGEKPDIAANMSQWLDAFDALPDNNTPIDQMVNRLQALLKDRRMLLIIDDAWTEDAAHQFDVGGKGCAQIITTRFNDVARSLAPTAQDIYRIPILSDDDSLSLLELLTPQTVGEYPDASSELVKDLEGLPLAIQVAGRLLDAESHMGWGVEDLLAELREGAKLLAAEAPADRQEWLQETSPTVTVLLRKSTDSLDPETHLRFAMLGALAPKPATFDMRAISFIWQVDDPKPTIRKLVDRGLLEPTGQRFQMHALLAMHARSLFGEEKR